MKICLKCNAENSEEVLSCSNCNAGVFRHVPLPAVKNENYNDYNEINFKYKLGGWLSVFIIAFMGEMILKSLVVFSFIDELIASQIDIFSLNLDIAIILDIVFSVIYSIVMVFVGIFITINFFKKKRKTPKYLIIFFTIELVYHIAKLILSQSLFFFENSGTIDSRILGEIFQCIVWIMYFRSSKRVKYAFTD